MHAYTISIAGAAVLGAVINMLSPDKWSKYISIVTGLVIAVSIGSPIISLFRSDVLSELSFNAAPSSTQGTDIFYRELKQEFERRIENDVKSRVASEFGMDVTAEAEAATDEKGQITGVKKITVYGGHPDNIVIGRLREVYGAAEVKTVADKKLSKKPE